MTLPPQIALTVDLEDSHHGLGISKRSSSLARDVDWILVQFEQLGLRGTFFVLGEVVDSHPGLVREIAAAGHEIAFHGAVHRFIRDLGPKEFSLSLNASVPRLADLVGCSIRGFRAPFFSIVVDTQWCLDVLAEQGFEYDASIYPGPNDRYGWPQAPTTPVQHEQTGLVIFPVPLLHPHIPLAFSGGAYLRMLPYWLVEVGFRRQKQLGHPGMIYFHPWEISSVLAWRHEANARANLTRHLLRRRMRPQLQRLLAAKASLLGTMTDVIKGLGKLPAWNPADATHEVSAGIRI